MMRNYTVDEPVESEMRCAPSRLPNKNLIINFIKSTGIFLPTYKIMDEIFLLLLYAPTLPLHLLGLQYCWHTYNYLYFTSLTFETYLYNFIML